MMEQSYSRWQKLMERAKRENWGMFPSPPDEHDWPLFRIAKIPEVLPKKVDLSHHIPFILDQQGCGVCVAKSGVNALNIFFNSKKMLPDKGLSSLFLYTRCKQEDGMPDDEGTYPRVALKIMQKEGVCSAKLLPFEGKCKPLPVLTQQMKSNAQNYKIKAYARVYGVEQIKQALAAGKVVMVGTMVTKDNWLDGDEWILEPLGQWLGLHATLLCGYDDTLEHAGYRGFFKGINSWGEGWGEKGFYYMAYDYTKWENKDLPGLFALMEAWAVEFEEVLQPPEPSKKIELWIDQPIAKINETETMIDPANPKVTPKIIEGRTMLPARFIAEALGKEVSWDEKERKVTIE